MAKSDWEVWDIVKDHDKKEWIDRAITSAWAANFLFSVLILCVFTFLFRLADDRLNAIEARLDSIVPQETRTD